jgi:predicted HicB family RNase H-like nuclease
MDVQMNFRLPESLHTALKVRTATERTSVSKYLEKVLSDVLKGDLNVNLNPVVKVPKISTTTALVDHEVREAITLYAKEHNIPLNRLVKLAVEASLGM